MSRIVSIRTSIALLALLICGRSVAQESTVPVATQYPLFLKIFAYDHALADRSGDEVTIGILYQSRFRASRTALEELMDASRDRNVPLNIKGIPIRVVPLELKNERDVGQLLEANEIDLLYVTPLRSTDLRRLHDACRSRGVVSFTGVPEYVEEGVAVGLDLMGGKPKILINVAAAREEGASFSGQILQLARIVKS